MPTRAGQVVVLVLFVAWFIGGCWMFAANAEVTGTREKPASFSGVAR